MIPLISVIKSFDSKHPASIALLQGVDCFGVNFLLWHFIHQVVGRLVFLCTQVFSQCMAGKDGICICQTGCTSVSAFLTYIPVRQRRPQRTFQTDRCWQIPAPLQRLSGTPSAPKLRFSVSPPTIFRYSKSAAASSTYARSITNKLLFILRTFFLRVG